MINTVAIVITIFTALASLFSRLSIVSFGSDLFASLHALFFFRLSASNIVAIQTMEIVKIGKTVDLYFRFPMYRCSKVGSIKGVKLNRLLLSSG